MACVCVTGKQKEQTQGHIVFEHSGTENKANTHSTACHTTAATASAKQTTTQALSALFDGWFSDGVALCFVPLGFRLCRIVLLCLRCKTTQAGTLRTGTITPRPQPWEDRPPETHDLLHE